MGEYLVAEMLSFFGLRRLRLRNAAKFDWQALAGGKLRPKGWLLTTEGNFRESPAGKKVWVNNERDLHKSMSFCLISAIRS